MIRSDQHVHTYYSSDSEQDIRELLQTAVDKGLSSICITDHMDYLFPKNKEGFTFEFDVLKYFKELEELSFHFPQLTIHRGVELGLKEGIKDRCDKLTSSMPFDFVIGSTHLIDNIDPYFAEYWESTGEEAGIRKYFEVTLDNICQDFDFDVYGHIDYILRYAPSVKSLRNSQPQLDHFIETQINNNIEVIDEILRKLIQRGRGIEINTGGIKALNHTNPHELALKRYHQLKGEIITVGSDAHENKSLCRHFETIPSLLRQCGFLYYSEYENRKPVMKPL